MKSMPEFKNSKRRYRFNKSVDGIVPREGFHGRSSIDFNRQKEQRTTGGDIDNFSRSEGFHSAYQPMIEMPEADLAMKSEETNLTKHPKPKKFWLFRKLSRKQRGKKPWSKRTKIASGLAMVVLLVGGFFALKLYFNANKIFGGGGGAAGLSQCQDENQLHKEGDCRINVLILGVGGPGHPGADLTDTILLASVDPVNNKANLLNIPRDLWVQIPGYGYRKINEAYFYGKQYSKATSETNKKRDGIKMVDQTLNPILGIPINYHVLIDFTAFKQTVDAVGGVTVNVPEMLYDPSIAWENNYNPVIANKGKQKFDGAKALLYAKSRETSSDFARGQRQRLMMIALKDKILSLGTFSNPIKVSNLLSSLGNNVFTDFSLRDSSKIYDLVSKIPSGQIKSLDLVTPPHDLLTTANLDGLSIIQPKAGLFNYGAVQAYIHKVLRDGQLAREDARITISNATSTAGLAANKASELKSLGYRVNKVNNASRTPDLETSIIVDLSKGQNKFTRHYLEIRFNTKAIEDLPSEYGITPLADTDFVIILGKK